MSETESPKYRLKVTAGSQYNPDTHQLVPVNEDQSIRIENEHATISLCVRIQDYKGYPDNAPPSNPYFTHPLHTSDQYSISFAFIPKHPINGKDLIFGNDFDRPIRDRLPPGFNAALRLVQWTIDPTLDGDAYADRPYLFSPALATWNQFCVGGRVCKGDEVPTVHGVVVEEGAEGDGVAVREGVGLLVDHGEGDGEDGGEKGKGKGKGKGSVEERRKFFQTERNREGFVFEEGRVYWVDFGNPYLGFNDFSLHLPGFNINVLQYIDEDNHSLRYVLKNQETGDVYLVVLFTLVLQGTEEEPNHREWTEQARESNRAEHERNGGKLGRLDWQPEPSADDVD